MKFENIKIQPSEISAKGVASAPDRLSGTAAENKAVFDRLVKDVVVEKFNGFVDLVREEIESIEVPPEGAPGYTPIKGTDYWTEADKAEINALVKEATLQTLREEDLAEISESIAETNAGLEALEERMPSMELLWSNASPTSAFPAQTLNLDVASGDLVLVISMHSTGYLAVRVPSFSVDSNLVDISDPAGLDRSYRKYDGRIEFQEGKRQGAQDNGVLIPFKIYKFKGGSK